MAIVTIDAITKVVRKAGAFTTGQLLAGQLGINTTNGDLYLSTDGIDVVQYLQGAPGERVLSFADFATAQAAAPAVGDRVIITGDQSGVFIVEASGTIDDVIVFDAGSGNRFVRVYDAALPFPSDWCGAVGDGTTDDSTALAALFSAAQTHGAVGVSFRKAEYALTSQSAALDASNLTVHGNGAVLTSDGTDNTEKGYIIKAEGSLWDPGAGAWADSVSEILNAAATRGSMEIEVVYAQCSAYVDEIDSRITDGDSVLLIIGTDTLYQTYDVPENTPQGEMVEVVDATDDGGGVWTLTLNKPLYDTYALGDEFVFALVDTVYCDISGLTLQHDAETSFSRGLLIKYAHDPKIDVRFGKCYNRCVQFEDVYGGECRIHTPHCPEDGNGYGVGVHGASTDLTIRDSTIRGARHALTTGGHITTFPYDPPTTPPPGVPWGLRLVNVRGTSYYNTCFDTHATSGSVYFYDCVAEHGPSPVTATGIAIGDITAVGFGLEGGSIYLYNCRVFGGSYGLNVTNGTDCKTVFVRGLECENLTDSAVTIGGNVEHLHLTGIVDRRTAGAPAQVDATTGSVTITGEVGMIEGAIEVWAENRQAFVLQSTSMPRKLHVRSTSHYPALDGTAPSIEIRTTTGIEDIVLEPTAYGAGHAVEIDTAGAESITSLKILNMIDDQSTSHHVYIRDCDVDVMTIAGGRAGAAQGAITHYLLRIQDCTIGHAEIIGFDSSENKTRGLLFSGTGDLDTYRMEVISGSNANAYFHSGLPGTTERLYYAKKTEAISQTKAGVFTGGELGVGELGIDTVNDDLYMSTNGTTVVLVNSGGGAEVNDLTAAVTWANIPDVNVPQSAVTQHEGALDHDALTNFVAAEHIDWSVTGAEDVHVDRVAQGAVTQHEGAINHDNLTGFVANEHIDWTAASAGTIDPTNFAVRVDTQSGAYTGGDLAAGELGIDTATGDLYLSTDGTDAIKYVSETEVIHGATAGTARPSGYSRVVWVGSVEPTNATQGDVWVKT